MTRRNLLALTFGGLAASLEAQRLDLDLPLRDYEPHSALTVPRTPIEGGPRSPVIDMHTHMGFGGQARRGRAGPRRKTVPRAAR